MQHCNKCNQKKAVNEAGLCMTCAGVNDIRKLKCPMCGSDMEHKHQGDTHIYVCETCPFLGLEYFNIPNLSDLTDYINRT